MFVRVEKYVDDGLDMKHDADTRGVSRRGKPIPSVGTSSWIRSTRLEHATARPPIVPLPPEETEALQKCIGRRN